MLNFILIGLFVQKYQEVMVGMESDGVEASKDLMSDYLRAGLLISFLVGLALG